MASASTPWAILDASPVATVAVDLHGVVTLWNPAATRLLGWAADEALGSPLPLVLSEDDAGLGFDLASLLAGVPLVERELRIVRRDGEHIGLSLSLAPLRDGAGVTGAVAALTAVAGRAADAERDIVGTIAELALSRGRMVAGRLDRSTGALAWFGEDAGAEFWNGSPPASFEDLLGRILAEDQQLMDTRALSSDRLVDIDFRVHDVDGSIRWLQAHGLLVDDGTANVRVGVVLDVTEARRREAELRDTSELLHAVIAASPLAVTASEPDGRVTMWSPAAEAMFGWTADEVLGRQLPFVRAEDWPALRELRGRVLRGEVIVDLETVRQRKDGSTIDASVSIAPLNGADGEVCGLVGMTADISERVRAQHDLASLAEQASETAHMLSAIVRSSPAAIVALDLEQRVTAWNPAAERIFGWSAGEVVGKPFPWEDGAPDDDADLEALLHTELMRRAFAHPRLQRAPADHGDGGVEVALSPLGNGHRFGTMAIVTDVSERQRAERALREAEARYRTLVEQLPAVVYIDDVTDARGRTLYVSPQVEAMFGISVETWMDAHVDVWLELVHPDDRARVLTAYQRTADGFESLDVEYRLGQDDEKRWVRDIGRVVPASDAGPAQLHGIVYDITDLKEVQVELERSVELLRASDAARSRLVSRLVHVQEEERRVIAGDLHDDAVQAMTAVGLRLGHLRRSADHGRLPTPADFEKLETTVRDAQRRMRRLLFELRPAELDRGGLAATLTTQLAEQEAELGLAYRIESRLAEEPSPDARVIAYRLTREALANARVHAQATEVVVELESRQGGVYGSVHDDGVGFDAESVLTDTRPNHLGLQAMRERAELAGGWLRITSDVGVGTTVEYWVPDGQNCVGADGVPSGSSRCP